MGNSILCPYLLYSRETVSACKANRYKVGSAEFSLESFYATRFPYFALYPCLRSFSVVPLSVPTSFLEFSAYACKFDFDLMDALTVETLEQWACCIERFSRCDKAAILEFHLQQLIKCKFFSFCVFVWLVEEKDVIIKSLKMRQKVLNGKRQNYYYIPEIKWSGYGRCSNVV